MTNTDLVSHNQPGDDTGATVGEDVAAACDSSARLSRKKWPKGTTPAQRIAWRREQARGRVVAHPPGAAKACAKCGEQKLLDGGYYRDALSPDGLYTVCKRCQCNARRGGADRKLRTWPEGATMYDRVKQWRADHRDRARLLDALGRKVLRWAARWPEACAAFVTAYGPGCIKCGATDDVMWDHVVPLPDGPNQPGNLQRLCRRCNTAKRTLATDYRPDGGAAARAVEAQWPIPVGRYKRATGQPYSYRERALQQPEA
jgi:5-methylcytosine-specific restriction endonuclease McrA